MGSPDQPAPERAVDLPATRRAAVAAEFRRMVRPPFEVPATVALNAALMCAAAAAQLAPLVTSVVVGKDMIPRLTLGTGRQLLDRRRFLGDSATGLGSIALASLLAAEESLAADPGRIVIDPARPHAPRSPHFAAKAKNVLVIFCAGAVSQLETWDWKPDLVRHDDRGAGANWHLQGVEARVDEDVIDETPGAYKNIEAAMAAQADLVEVVHTLKQVLVVKG